MARLGARAGDGDGRRDAPRRSTDPRGDQEHPAGLPDGRHARAPRRSGCETFGGPSTQSFAAWGTAGAGISIFLVDTFKYSDGHFNAGGFIGNVFVPLSLAIVTSIGRSANFGNDTLGVSQNGQHEFENWGQNLLAGAIPGLLTGVLFGVGYTLLQRPNCGYGNNVICW